jgi:hypothetical protein
MLKIRSLATITALLVLVCQSADAAPTAPAKTTAAAAAAVDASKLRVEVGRAGLEDESYVHIFGEVHNDTGQPIEAVKVHIELLDAKGAPLEVGGWHREVMKEELALGEMHYVPAGGSTPFHYIRDAKKIKGTYGSHRIRATARPRTTPMPTVAIEGLSAKPQDMGQVDLKGTFKVTGTVACRSPEAHVGFFDANGKLVDIVTPHNSALDTWFQKSLPAGQSVAFEGKSFPQGGGKAAGTKTKVWGSCSNWISE